MSLEPSAVAGALATLCSITSFAPQAWKIIRTRDTASISAPMYALTVTGFALWLLYGVLRADLPLMVTNGVCLLFSGFILIMTLLPQRQKEKVGDMLDPASESGDTDRP